MKFKSIVYNQHIGVEGQDLVVKFCFAKQVEPELYSNMSDWSECRDFMGDCVVGMYTKKESAIYGFSFDPKTRPLDMDRCLIGIRFPNKNIRDTFVQQLPELQCYLMDNALPSDIIVQKLTGSPNTFVLQLDKFWQQTTFNISYITFLLKSICWEFNTKTTGLLNKIHSTTKNNNATKEANYLEHGVKNNLAKVIPNLVKLTAQHTQPDGYSIEQHISMVHNRSGFYYNCRWSPTDTVIGKWLKEQPA